MTIASADDPWDGMSDEALRQFQAQMKELNAQLAKSLAPALKQASGMTEAIATMNEGLRSATSGVDLSAMRNAVSQIAATTARTRELLAPVYSQRLLLNDFSRRWDAVLPTLPQLDPDLLRRIGALYEDDEIERLRESVPSEVQETAREVASDPAAQANTDRLRKQTQAGYLVLFVWLQLALTFLVLTGESTPLEALWAVLSTHPMGNAWSLSKRLTDWEFGAEGESRPDNESGGNPADRG